MRHENRQQPVVVVGAGPVGLTAALALRRLGLDVLVLEGEPQGRPRPGSRAIFLMPWTLGRFSEVLPGLGERIGEAGIQVRGGDCYYAGRRIFDFHSPVLPALTRGTSLPQTETEAILYAECVAHGIEFHWDAKVRDVRTDGEGVTLTLENCTKVRAPYAIAADGARSAVRKGLGLRMCGHTDDVPFIIVDVAELPDGSTASKPALFHYRTPELGGRNVMHMPFRGGMRVDLQCRRGDDVAHLASPAGVREWLPQILDPWYADHIRWISTYRFQQVVAETYTDPQRRILLAGEAAHLFAPFGGGRGLNSGVIDATDAATAIAKALAAEHSTAAAAHIDACAADRREAGRYNRDAAAAALRLMRARDPLTFVTREIAGRIAPHFPPAGAWLALVPPMGRLGIRPGASSIY
ncbi:FAD-dependent oxidoreductase [Nocardia brasiliensis]|uniref:FAD-dependent oxidoreductase n=1 Tax=Nocardia brasiliensis TaxID=37326 RepID=UPI001895D87B|nr:FAD-dependent monooxygenase [Nocardia brasiliensis]MBF6541575.1 FAD-dependent monooxygenase [Nocardia brasiliensis]